MRIFCIILLSLLLLTLFLSSSFGNPSVNTIEFYGNYNRILVTNDESSNDFYEVKDGKVNFLFSDGQDSGYYLVYWLENGKWYRKWIRVFPGVNKIELKSSMSNYGLLRAELDRELEKHTKNKTMTVVIDGIPMEVSVLQWNYDKCEPDYYLMLIEENDDVERSKVLADKLKAKNVMPAVVGRNHWRVSGVQFSVGECLLFSKNGSLLAKWKHGSDDKILEEVEKHLSGNPSEGDYNKMWIYIIVAIIILYLLFRKSD